MQIKRLIILLSAVLGLQSSLRAQVTLVLNEPMRSDFSYSAIKKISLTSGFSTGTGTNYDFSASVFPTPPSGWYEPAQPSGAYNYSITTSPRIALSESLLNSVLAGSEAIANSEIIQEISYIDGLGRPLQEISVASAPDGDDIIQFHEYDGAGREAIAYMPFNANEVAGAYVANPLTKEINFYNTLFTGEGAFANAETSFDGSPLNRVLYQSSPGNGWQVEGGHEMEFKNLTNTTTVKRWIAGTGLYDISNPTPGTYAVGELFVSETTNEDKGKTREYTDKMGQVVLKEAELDVSNILRTYYVYDDFGLLRAVIPPKAMGVFNLDLCYEYLYDARHRLIEKQIPGAEAVYMVYDIRDRLVATQDGNMRARNVWMITKYDGLNRPVLTIEYRLNNSREGLQTLVNSYTSESNLNTRWVGFSNYNIKGYSMGGLGGTSIFESDLLSATYYDSYYGWDLTPDLTATTPNISGLTNSIFSNFTNSYTKNTTGLVTASFVRNLESTQAYLTVNYYDEKGRLIQQASQTHLGKIDRTFNLYDFTDAVTATLHQQSTVSSSVREAYRYEYDHRGRPTNTIHQIPNKTEILLSTQSYNKLGQVSQKKLHSTDLSNSTTALQTIDYSYNIKGWLTGINNPNSLGTDLFAMNLLYNNINTAQNLTAQSNFNGNISAVLWSDANSNKLKGYGYGYDKLNRLKKANYGDATNWESNAYDVGGKGANDEIEYDRNGNILSLYSRNSDGGYNNFNDHLRYSYTGNQLRALTDNGSDPELTATQYSYDNNGSMIGDSRLRRSITYNVLNLPQTVQNYRDVEQNYTYNTAGTKLRYEYNGSITDYVSNFVYQDGTLIYMLTPEGRILVNGSTYTYEYHLTDHLGNTRVTFTAGANGTATVTQVVDYYPFGSPHYYDLGDANQKYLYNGKELQDGTGWLDYGFRMYDPALGRWHVMEPFAADIPGISPYAYAYNNPVSFVDMFGLWAGDPDVVYDESVSDEALLDNWLSSGLWEFTVTAQNPNNQQLLTIAGEKYGWIPLSGYDEFAIPEAQYPPYTNSSSLMHYLEMKINLVSPSSSSGQWGTYSIDNAVNSLNDNAFRSWEDANGKCATYIRWSLEAGFGLKKDALKGLTVDQTGKTIGCAKTMGPYLENFGFRIVNTTSYLKGDIAVIQGYPGGTSNEYGETYGHVQMYNDSKTWISDFYQLTDFWPGPGYRNKHPTFVIYRRGN